MRDSHRDTMTTVIRIACESLITNRICSYDGGQDFDCAFSGFGSFINELNALSAAQSSRLQLRQRIVSASGVPLLLWALAPSTRQYRLTSRATRLSAVSNRQPVFVRSVFDFVQPDSRDSLQGWYNQLPPRRELQGSAKVKCAFSPVFSQM